MYEILENDEFRLYNRTFDTYAEALNTLIRFESDLRKAGHITEPIVNGAFRYWVGSIDVGILVQIHKIGD